MARSIQFGPHLINDESDCYVIAEIGHNHQGKLETCKEMFRAAKDCGAHAVKIQKRNNRTLYTKKMFNQPYEHRNSYAPTYGEHREFLEFGRGQYLELKAYAAELGITFFSTAFDIESADFLEEIGMPVYKIASGDIVNTPLLEHVARFQKPMIISTGGATLEDVDRAYEAIIKINPQVAILQCTSGYPAEFEELNLRVISTLRERYPETVIGLSSHDNGIAMAVAGYVLGARIVEKHFTLNRAWKGTDQAFSLEPIGLRKMVRDLRRTRLAFGDGVKRPYPSEIDPLIKMRKKLVAKCEIAAGTVLQHDHIAMRSPADGGLLPYELNNVLGKTLLVDLKEDDNITFEILR